MSTIEKLSAKLTFAGGEKSDLFMNVQFVLGDERLSTRITAKRANVFMQLHVLLQTEVSIELFAAVITLELRLLVHHNVFVKF